MHIISLLSYVCDLICNKRPLLANSCDLIWVKGPYIHIYILYTYSCFVYTTIHGNCVYTKPFLDVLTMVPFHKSGHKWFDRSGPIMQIRSHTQHICMYVCISIKKLTKVRCRDQYANKRTEVWINTHIHIWAGKARMTFSFNIIYHYTKSLVMGCI